MTQPLTTPPALTNTSAIPTLHNQQMQEVYRLMVEEYGLGQSTMLELAGRCYINLARRLVGGNLSGQSLTVLAGGGHCGAAGLVAARYLTNAGAQVAIVISRPPDMLSPAAAHQYRLLNRLGQTVHYQIGATRLIATLRQSALVLDSLLGGGLHGWPTGNEAFLIQALRQSGATPLSLDLPSGLPADDEPIQRPELVVQARATLALALPRLAHIQPANLSNIGELYLADIGVPPHLYTRLGYSVGPLFNTSEIILLRRPQITSIQ